MNFILDEYPSLCSEYERLLELDIIFIEDILSSQITSLMRRLEDIYELEGNFRIMYGIDKYMKYVKYYNCLCEKSELVFNYILLFPLISTIDIPIKKLQGYLDCNLSTLALIPSFINYLYYMFRKYIKTENTDICDIFNNIKKYLTKEEIKFLITDLIHKLPFNHFCNCKFALSLGPIPEFFYYKEDIYYNEKGMLIVPKHEVVIKKCNDTCELWYNLIKHDLKYSVKELYLNNKKLI